MMFGGQDLDPPDDTLGLADVSYSPSSGALTFLNRAAAAPLPTEAGPIPDACRSATGWKSQIDADTELGSTSCLRTSDSRYGTISITDINPTRGQAYIAWTVWY